MGSVWPSCRSDGVPSSEDAAFGLLLPSETLEHVFSKQEKEVGKLKSSVPRFSLELRRVARSWTLKAKALNVAHFQDPNKGWWWNKARCHQWGPSVQYIQSFPQLT